jgi:hypothetical protein
MDRGKIAGAIFTWQAQQKNEFLILPIHRMRKPTIINSCAAGSFWAKDFNPRDRPAERSERQSVPIILKITPSNPRDLLILISSIILSGVFRLCDVRMPIPGQTWQCPRPKATA